MPLPARDHPPRSRPLPVRQPALRAQQQDPTLSLLQRLSDAPGTAGAEDPVRAIIVSELKPIASAPIRFDGMGSVIAELGTAGPRILIDAHMDELGGMVRRIAPNGQLTMQMLGGWLDQALPDQRWIIWQQRPRRRRHRHSRHPRHHRPRAHRRHPPRIHLPRHRRQLPAEAAAMGIEPGDPIVPDSKFTILNGSDNYLGKAWDDRIGRAVLVQAMQRLAKLPHPNHLFFVATTQEEIGLRGARTAANLVHPDLGFALEGGIANDQGGHSEETQAHLGAGPGIFLYDTSAIPNRKLVAFVRSTAKDNNIPLQLDLVQGYGDDSAEIQESGTGAPSLNIVVPVRYTHSHNGIVNRKTSTAP